MAALVISPLPGAGRVTRLAAMLRGLLSRRLLLKLAGVDCVVLQGRVHVLRAVPLGVARELVPAIIRCSRRFAALEIDESLYDDFVTVLALGLGAPRRQIDQLSVPLWHLGPVVEAIAQVNGLPKVENGASLGKLLATLTQSTGTSSMPSSSAPPAGPGTTSTAT